MLAMAISRTPSPASLAPTDCEMSGMAGSRKTCRSRLVGCPGWRVHAKPVGARLAGDGDFMDAFAGKPGSYGLRGCWRFRVHPKPVGAGLLAMAISRTPSPASLAPTERGMSGMAGSPKTCRSSACWRWRFHGRHRQQAGSYKSRGCWRFRVHAKPVGVRPAGDGDFMGAFAGKPGSYGFGGVGDCRFTPHL